VREAKKAGVKYIVKQSVMGADAEPEITPTPIRLHRQAEKIIEESKIPFTFLRSNSYMQNFVNFYSHSVKTQGAFYVPAGDARISFVDVRDIAAIAVHALTSTNSKHEGKAHNITGGEALSHGQAAEILSEQLGKKVNYINVSDEDARKGMKDMGMDEWIINSIIELFEFAKAGHWSAISPVTEQITGNKPISFSQFASDNAASFK
jgi:uncharacterized protein YbjT (DUF2867 family)